MICIILPLRLREIREALTFIGASMVLKNSTRFDAQAPFHRGDIIGSLVGFTKYTGFVVAKYGIHLLGIYFLLLSITFAAHRRRGHFEVSLHIKTILVVSQNKANNEYISPLLLPS